MNELKAQRQRTKHHRDLADLRQLLKQQRTDKGNDFSLECTSTTEYEG